MRGGPYGVGRLRRAAAAAGRQAASGGGCPPLARRICGASVPAESAGARSQLRRPSETKSPPRVRGAVGSGGYPTRFVWRRHPLPAM